jgi:hypothetical protein
MIPSVDALGLGHDHRHLPGVAPHDTGRIVACEEEVTELPRLGISPTRGRDFGRGCRKDKV